MTAKFIAVAAALLLAACSNSMSRRAPIQMNPAPAQPVTSEQLAPPPGSNPGMAGQQDSYGYPQQDGYGYPQDGSSVAGSGQQTGGQPSAVATTVAAPTKEDVLGQWTIADSNSSCQLNVSLTGWSGGYRASTRNCASAELTRVGAWNIEGNNLVLKDQGGQQVAVLTRAGERRFNGALAVGGPVAMLR